MKITAATLAVATACLLALPATTASAGTYKAMQCYERTGAGYADATYTSSSNRYRRSADCGGRGLGITHVPGRSATGSGRYGAWALTAPAGTRIVRAAARVSAKSQGWHVPQIEIGFTGGGRDRLAGVRGDLHTVSWQGVAGRSLTGRLTCANRNRCKPGRDAYLYMRRIALTLRDDVAPDVELGGSLVERGSRRGKQTLEVGALDSGSGVRDISVALNGDPLAARRMDCSVAAGVALRLRPCPAGRTASFEISTELPQFRQGPNELRVCVADFAPRSASNRACKTRTIRVDNLCPVATRPGAVLRARFEDGGERTVGRSDTAERVVGSLVDEAGQPVRGAEVCVATRIRAGGSTRERVVATPATDADGRFAARIPAGPSREVRVAHWPGRARAIERYLALDVKAIPRLAVGPGGTLRNGDRARFAARLPGPANGHRRVTIQARSNGRWFGIAGGLTNRAGRWRGAYRFRSTTGTRRYAFRAVVKKQRGYPYAGGRSKIRRLTVAG